MNPINKKIIWKFQKNWSLVESLILRNAPEFVYKSKPAPLDGEIPVFTFHAALPDWFEEQCRHLRENGYRTLSADEFFTTLTRPRRPQKKSILLTFDDGLKHVWTIAYPLLKKFNLKATCFLVPGCIPENDKEVRPTIEDYWKGDASYEEIVSLRSGKSALANWSEIKIMHESGIIDFQSHTMYHSLVFTSNRIFDFVNPCYNVHFFGNIHIPLYSIHGKEVTSREIMMGMPIYYAKPRMVAERRFIDDEEIRNRCIEVVKREGPEDFFKRKNWRKILRKEVLDCRKRGRINERYETTEDRDKAILEELVFSKQVIEEKLPGKKVTHLCYPWYDGKDFAIQASKKAGFKVNYFGLIKGRPANRSEDYPYKVARIDDIFLQRLPGIGRKNIINIFRRIYDQRTIPQILGI